MKKLLFFLFLIPFAVKAQYVPPSGGSPMINTKGFYKVSGSDTTWWVQAANGLYFPSGKRGSIKFSDNFRRVFVSPDSIVDLADTLKGSNRVVLSPSTSLPGLTVVSGNLSDYVFKIKDLSGNSRVGASFSTLFAQELHYWKGQDYAAGIMSDSGWRAFRNRSNGYLMAWSSAAKEWARLDSNGMVLRTDTAFMSAHGDAVITRKWFDAHNSGGSGSTIYTSNGVLPNRYIQLNYNSEFLLGDTINYYGLYTHLRSDSTYRSALFAGNPSGSQQAGFTADGLGYSNMTAIKGAVQKTITIDAQSGGSMLVSNSLNEGLLNNEDHTAWELANDLALISTGATKQLIADSLAGHIIGNIYNIDGTLTGNRTVNLLRHSLGFTTSGVGGSNTGLGIDTVSVGMQATGTGGTESANIIVTNSGSGAIAYMQRNYFGTTAGVSLPGLAGVGVGVHDGLGYGLFYDASSDYANALADPSLSPLLILPKEANDLLYAPISSSGSYINNSDVTSTPQNASIWLDNANAILVGDPARNTQMSNGNLGAFISGTGFVSITHDDLNWQSGASHTYDFHVDSTGNQFTFLASPGTKYLFLSQVQSAYQPTAGNDLIRKRDADSLYAPISGSGITALTGDGTASGPGSAALTLATVNFTTGSFGDATHTVSFDVTGKGLITAASSVAVIFPVTLSNSVSLTNKNLTSGTNTFPTFNQNTTGSAATLTTPRAINGVNFDGSAAITVTAAPSGTAGGELAGTYPIPTLLNSAVIAKVLTGYTSGSGTVASTDNILQAIQKLNGNDGLRVLYTDTSAMLGNVVHIAKNEAVSGQKTFNATILLGSNATVNFGSTGNNALNTFTNNVSSNTALTLATSAANSIIFSQNASEKARFSSTGHLLINNATDDGLTNFLQVTGKSVIYNNGIAATATDGLQIVNSTASTSGVPAQYTPSLIFGGHVWNTTATAADNWVNWRMYSGVTSSTSPTAFWNIDYSRSTTSTPSYSNIFNLTQAGNLAVTGSIQATGYTATSSGITSTNAFIQLTKTAIGAAISTQNFIAQANTASTVGTPNQWSPGFLWNARVWNTTATAADNWAMWNAYVSTTSSTTPTSSWNLAYSLNTNGTASYSTKFAIAGDGTVTTQAPVILKGYTVAGLPAGTVGMTAYVTDALTPSFGTTLIGGGAVVTKAFYNGTNWIAE